MAEIETYARTGNRTYTIMGGKRDTTYDNLAQAVKRVGNLYKQGKRIYRITYNLEADNYCIGVYDQIYVPRTPGFQRTEYHTAVVYENHQKVKIPTVLVYMSYIRKFWEISPVSRRA